MFTEVLDPKNSSNIGNCLVKLPEFVARFHLIFFLSFPEMLYMNILLLKCFMW